MTLAVYFDLDGTLLSYDVPFSELFAGTIRSQTGVDPGDAANELFTERVLDGIEAIEPEPVVAAMAAVVEKLELDADPSALADEYIEREIAATTLAAADRELVASVANAHPTGILTNGIGRVQRGKVEAHGLDQLVEEIVVSNAVGVRKPDAELFEIAAERLPAEEHCYVGDTLAEDILGARGAGWRAIHVRCDDEPPAVAVSRVGELTDVLDLGH